MKKIFRSAVCLLAGLSMLSLVSCGKKDASGLVGAGATFPLPYYNMAFDTYKTETGVSVNYGPQGSGAGIRSLFDRLVDFAGSDAFLNEDEMKALPEVIHVPTCLGAAVLAYNLPGVENLQLTPALLSDIYMGKLTMWSDPAIAAVNPDVKLPDLKIFPVYRSDGSGTTYVFSYYLSQVSEEWAQEVVLDVFMSLWNQRATLSDVHNIEDYCFILTRNAALNYLEKEKRHASRSLETVPESDGTDQSPEEQLISDELFARYVKALDRLPQRCREVFIRVREEKQSYADVAEALGISVKTVDAQLQKATSRLRELLKESLT